MIKFKENARIEELKELIEELQKQIKKERKEFLDDLNNLSTSIGEWGDAILVSNLIERWEEKE